MARPSTLMESPFEDFGRGFAKAPVLDCGFSGYSSSSGMSSPLEHSPPLSEFPMKFAPVLMLALILSACGSGDPPDAPEASDQAMADYQDKVGKKVTSSVVNSLVREWDGVSENQVRCLLQDLGVMQLERANEDPEVKAVFEKCGVDPAVVD